MESDEDYNESGSRDKRAQETQVAAISRLRPLLRDRQIPDPWTAPTQQSFERVSAKGNARMQIGHSIVYNIHTGDARDDGTSKTPQEEAYKAKAKGLLLSLAFSNMYYHTASIKQAYARTCRWFFDTPHYVRWRSSSMQAGHKNLLWIKGKPGSGKSIVMRRALRYATDHYSEEKVVSFFFNARGKALERSTEGMFRSLLHQMASDVPKLPDMVQAMAMEEYAKESWPLELLKELFSEAIHHLTSTCRVNCYIDALDEADVEEDVRDLISYLEGIKSMKQPFSILFASRHYPNISISTAQQLVFDNHQGHMDDVAVYVQGNLKINDVRLKAETASEIIRRSSGLFLWAALAVGIINKEADHGNHHRLKSQLQAIPAGVRALLDDVLLSGDDSEYTLPLVQLVLLTYEPLGPEELYHAIMVATGHLNIVASSRNPYPVDSRMIDKFLLSSSKGLVEVTGDVETSEQEVDKNSPTSRAQGKVRFVHESVREYLSQTGLQKLDPSEGKDAMGLGHEHISVWCQEYIRLAFKSFAFHATETPLSVKLQALKSWPLLSYALYGALRHAEAAATIMPSCCPIAEFPLGPWLLLQGMSLYKDPFAYHTETSMICLLASGGYSELLKSVLERTPGDSQGERQACLNDQWLDHGTWPEARGAALHIAILQGHYKTARLLIDYGTNVNAYCDSLGTPLHVAVTQGHFETTRVLLERGANANAQSFEVGTVLNTAILSHLREPFSLQIFDLLLTHGARISSRIEGQFDAVQLLAQHGGDIEISEILSKFDSEAF